MDLRAEMVVVFPPLIAEANLLVLGEALVHVLVVYGKVAGALERVLSRRPAKVRVLLYARE